MPGKRHEVVPAQAPLIGSAVGSLIFAGVASPYVPPVLTPPPLGHVYLRHVTAIMPAPTITAGNPQDNWSPTSVIDSDWGRLAIFADGIDVTFLRGVTSIVEKFSHARPYGPLACTLRFPQVSIFDTLGTGDLAWCHEGANIDIVRIHPDETFGPSDTLWAGLLEPVQHKRGEELTGHGMIVTGVGVGHQLGFYRRAPGISAIPFDIGTRLWFEWASRVPTAPALTGASPGAGRWTPPAAPVTTGVLSNYRGNWESALEFLTKLSEESLDNVGNQWLCMWVPPRQITILQLGPGGSADYTVQAGAPGVDVDLTQEPTTAANVIYGEGVDDGGQTWRNLYVNNGEPFFEPLAYDPTVHPIDANPDGTLSENDARLVLTTIRKEAYQGKGQGISFALGQASALALYQQLKDPGWVGTVTLRTSPAEVHMLEMLAGKNVAVEFFGGPAGQQVMIAGMEATIGELTGSSAMSVKVTVDSKARNLPTLMEVLKRQADLARSPVKRLLSGKSSAIVQDSTFIWDANRSGWLPAGDFSYRGDPTTHLWSPVATLGFRWPAGSTATVPCPGGQWTMAKMLASERDSAIQIAVTTEAVATPFVFALFDRPPAFGSLPTDPTGPGEDVTLRAVPGYIIHWGNNGQRAGFSPGLESNSDPLTGLLSDATPWSWTHDSIAQAVRTGGENPALYTPAFLYACIWSVSTCSMWANLTRLAIQ